MSHMSCLGNCNTTAIGSLPYDHLDKSHQLIKSNLDIPHWPQLPKLGASEGFINQYLTPLIDIGIVKVRDGITAFFDTGREDFTDLLTKFYTIYLAAMEGDGEALKKFGFPKDSAKGFYSFLDRLQVGEYEGYPLIKGQVSGPITLGLQITDMDRRSIYYDDQLKDVLVKTLALNGKWQAEQLKKWGHKVIIFIDDPGLYSLGLSTHITLTKEGISADLNQVIEAIKEAGAMVGTHTCASTDWALLFNLDLQVVNFDAYQYFSSISVYPQEIQEFLKKGGVMAFGLIPTSDQVLNETSASLTQLFLQQVEILAAKGVNRDLLLRQTLITPACGTGNLATSLADMIYLLTSEVSTNIKQTVKKHDNQ